MIEPYGRYDPYTNTMCVRYDDFLDFEYEVPTETRAPKMEIKRRLGERKDLWKR